MSNFSKVLIPCTSLGSIMNNPFGSLRPKQQIEYEELLTKRELTAAELKKLSSFKEKDALSYELSDGCKSFLVRRYAIEKYYSGRKGIWTAAAKKGSLVEKEAFDLFMKAEGRMYNSKKTLLKNKFISGSADMYDGSTPTSSTEIIEVKSSWNIFSFLGSIGKPIKPSYYWQLMGYLWLSGAQMGTIAFCLVNTPAEIMEEEKKRVMTNRKLFEEDEDKFHATMEELSIRMNFNDIPIQDRVIRISVERDEVAINKIEKKVEKCREYLAEFEKVHEFFTKNTRREKLLAFPSGK